MHSCEPAKLVDSSDCSIINEVKACAMNTGTLIFIFLCFLLSFDCVPFYIFFPLFFLCAMKLIYLIFLYFFCSSDNATD